MNTITRWVLSRAIALMAMSIMALVLIALPLRAATIDEIISMQEAGISPEIIIEVIDATGLEDPMDEDAWSALLEADIDPLILEYLVAEYLANSDDDEWSWEDDESGSDNRMGGEGFHHEPTGYSPIYTREYQGYYGDSYYNDYYYGGRYDYNSGIVVYEPPVWVWHDYPTWYSGWNGPGFYRHDRHHNRGYGGHSYYGSGWGFPYYYNNRHYYDDGWGGYGRFRYDGWRNRWDNDFGLWYRNDDFGFRIRF
jgi:hypothetical protein